MDSKQISSYCQGSIDAFETVRDMLIDVGEKEVLISVIQMNKVMKRALNANTGREAQMIIKNELSALRDDFSKN